MRVLSPDACGATRRHQRIHAYAECHGAECYIWNITGFTNYKVALQTRLSDQVHVMSGLKTVFNT